jgi:hypothetical protein
VKHRHVPNREGGGGNHNGGKIGGKGNQATIIKSIQRTIAALSTKFDKFNIHDEDNDDSSEEEEGSSNRSDSTLTHQSKKKDKRS